MLLLAPPSPVQVHTNGLTAWFTAEHVAQVGAILLVAIFVMTIWRILKGHPVIFVIVAIFVLVIGGYMTFNTGKVGGTRPAPAQTGRR